MEKHFWTKEPLITNINLNHVVVECFVHKSSKLIALDYFALVKFFFFIEFLEFFLHVYTAVAESFFDCLRDFHSVAVGDNFSSIFQRLEDKLCDVSSSQW